MIKFMDFQLTSYCNRKCSFCPPQSIYRQNKRVMTDECFEDIKSTIREGLELKLIEDNICFSINRYFEPFSDIDILNKRADELKELIPNSTISTQSNGDFLTKELAEKLTSSIDEVKINYYTADYFEVLVNVLEFFGYVEMDVDNDNHKINIKVGKTNWTFVWNKVNIMKFKNRGSVMLDIHSEDRTEECNIPKNSLIFDVDGTVMPCCDSHSSVEQHKELIVGNAKDGFISLYNKLRNFNWKCYSSCEKCNATYDTIFGCAYSEL